VPIDSYRFLDFATRQIMKAWAARQEPGAIPFTRLGKPLRECSVALVSTAGVARSDDRPFDQDGERRDPWWGDPSFRAIPLGTAEKDVRLYHMHIDPRFGEADLDVVLPMRRLAELAGEGAVGRAAATHYSIGAGPQRGLPAGGHGRPAAIARTLPRGRRLGATLRSGPGGLVSGVHRLVLYHPRIPGPFHRRGSPC
jgi:D-proline reductase (dithiol) PrdB